MLLPIPVKKGLQVLGRDIRTARIRRRVTMTVMAKHAAISRTTLTKIENGDPSVALGTYAAVIFILGLDTGLESFADSSKDLLGQSLDKENLPRRVRHSKK